VRLPVHVCAIDLVGSGAWYIRDIGPRRSATSPDHAATDLRARHPGVVWQACGRLLARDVLERVPGRLPDGRARRHPSSPRVDGITSGPRRAPRHLPEVRALPCGGSGRGAEHGPRGVRQRRLGGHSVVAQRPGLGMLRYREMIAAPLRRRRPTRRAADGRLKRRYVPVAMPLRRLGVISGGAGTLFPRSRPLLPLRLHEGTPRRLRGARNAEARVHTVQAAVHGEVPRITACTAPLPLRIQGRCR